VETWDGGGYTDHVPFDPPKPPPLEDAPPRGRVLCFAPHPDDEVIGPGGALCLHRVQGDVVRVVVASDGSAGDPDDRHDRAALVALRQEETRAALAELDVDDVAFWGFPDACVLTETDLALGVQRAIAELETFGPDVVYAPWAGERNPDHYALHVVVTRALAQYGSEVRALGYEVWDAMRPDFVLDVTPVFERKRRAVRCHRSQLEYVDYVRAVEGLNSYRTVQHLKGAGWAEGYCELGAGGGS